MKGTHHENALISAAMAICLSAVLLGANVVFGATPTLNPPGSGIAPTFTGLTVNGVSNLGQITASSISGSGSLVPSIVLKNGNVGIGDNDPQNKLVVNGNIVGNDAMINGSLAVSSDTQLDANLNVNGITNIKNLNVSGNISSLGSTTELFFADNGQIRSKDNNHRILFRRSDNKLELREYGDIVFSPGSTNGNETAKATITSAGHFKTTGGIGAFSNVAGTPQIVPYSSSATAYVSCPSGIPVSCGFTSTESPTLYITIVTKDGNQCKAHAKNSITSAQLYPSTQIIQATAVCFDSNG